MQFRESVGSHEQDQRRFRTQRAHRLDGKPGPPLPCKSERRTVLVFARAPALDLCRRRWPKNFGILFRSVSAEIGGAERADVHYFVTPGFSPPGVAALRVHSQAGATFGERLENAIESLARCGYDAIVVVGRDCPELKTEDINQAFSLLASQRLVLGPDHRGGCYLIGFHANDRLLLRGVRWQQDTDCLELQKRFGHEATALLSVKQDLDTLADVRRLARSPSGWRQVAEHLVESLTSEPFLRPSLPVDARDQNIRIDWQLPPPARIRAH